MEVKVGNVIICGDNPIVVQTMCNTHTSDVEASVAQCIRLAKAGAQMIRLTVPSLAQIEDLRAIRTRLRDAGIEVPLVADVHFSSEIAIAAASVVEKVRINPNRTVAAYPPASEQMNIEEMILGYTINGAKQLGIEAVKGSIEIGKDADFLVFDNDLLTAEHEGFSHNKPSEVYFGGNRVN